VKRILISLILALGIHGFLLGMEIDRFKKTFPISPKSRVISMTLTYTPSQAHEEKPVTNKPVSPEDRLINKKPKQVIKPKPKERTKTSIKKSFKPTVQLEEQSLPKVESTSELKKFQSPERSLDQRPVPHTDGMKKEILSSFEKELEIPTIQSIRKARPIYLINSPPQYPRTAKKRGFQGTVVLEILVEKNGSVGDLRLFTSSGHNILDRAAMAAVKDWLFKPGMRGNVKVEMWVRVPIRFQLN